MARYARAVRSPSTRQSSAVRRAPTLLHSCVAQWSAALSSSEVNVPEYRRTQSAPTVSRSSPSEPMIGTRTGRSKDNAMMALLELRISVKGMQADPRVILRERTNR
jgi:hypothetical protein